MDYRANLNALRAWMEGRGMDAVVIPSADPHLSEYPADHFRVREHFTGFTGSAGSAVIFRDAGYLFTDGRYFIQAGEEISAQGLALMKDGLPGAPSITEFLAEKLEKGAALGLDGRVFSEADMRGYRELSTRAGIVLHTDCRFADEVWTEDRPPLPSAPARPLAVEYAGKSTREKVADVRKAMQNLGAEHYVIASLDDIAWLMNMRGGDVPQFPVSYAYALISPSAARLFIDAAKAGDALRAHLTQNEVEICAYAEIDRVLADIPEEDCVVMDCGRVNAHARERISARVIHRPEITARMKSIKNSVELECIRRAHISDGAAMVRLLQWVEDRTEAGERLTEMAIAKKTDEFRREAPGNQDLSFPTISAFGPHGAKMHYRVTEESDIPTDRGLLVLDSGGQYEGATTDITRTLLFGEPTAREKTHYTLTLKSHILMARSIFLKDAYGGQIDALARWHMGQHGLDYKSGTGHGVGAGLSVHEGPQRIHAASHVPLEPGMIVSDEPGVYRAGEHGIRIENLYVVREHSKEEDGDFYAFECVTWCPIETKALDISLMDAAEIAWLNDYHALVWEKLSPALDDAEKAFLREKTKPIGV